MTRERRPIRDMRSVKTVTRGKGERLEARTLSRTGITITATPAPDEWPPRPVRPAKCLPKQGKRTLSGKQRIYPHYQTEEPEEGQGEQSRKGNGLQTQWHYGDYHVTHHDIGHHHLIGEVYNGYVTVFDTVQGHPERSKVYILQAAPSNAVVQFETRDANNDDKPDVTVGSEGSSIGDTLYYDSKNDTFTKQLEEGK